MPESTNSSMDQNKTIAIVAYILPFLFFLPLVTDAKNDAFARYHANQQLLLLIYWVAGSILTTMLMALIVGFILSPIHFIGGLVFAIMGIMNANKGEMKPLPLIGGITLLK